MIIYFINHGLYKLAKVCLFKSLIVIESLILKEDAQAEGVLAELVVALESAVDISCWNRVA